MMRSLFSGVSGLKNHQTRMDVIGNNISNVNTTGFKSARATFTDMLSQTLSGAAAPNDNIGGVNPKQIGLGSSVSAIETLFTNGSVQSTGKNTDLCLSSENALFILDTGSGTAYTRNGTFEFDADGNYVQAGNGYYVQGWMANNGTIDTGSGVDKIVIPSGKTMGPQASAIATYSNNLNSEVPTIVSVAGGTDVSEPPTVYNTDGESVQTKATEKVTVKLDGLVDPATYDVKSGGTYTVGARYPEGTSLMDVTEATNSANNTIKVTLSDGNSRTISTGTNTYKVGEEDPDSTATSKPTITKVEYAGNITEIDVTVPSAKASVENPVSLTLSDGSKVTYTKGTFTAGYSLPVATTLTVYDTLGSKHDVSVYLTKTGVTHETDASTGEILTKSHWAVSLDTSNTKTGTESTQEIKEADGTITTLKMNVAELVFDDKGKYESGSGNPSLSLENGSLTPQTIALDFSAMTQYASSSTIAGVADGNAAGTLSSISIDNSGAITGTYTNGVKQVEAQVALQRFTNPAGLTKVGDSLYEDSNNAGKSGEPNTAAAIGAKITPAALEMSNVDVADQFTDMIVTQRGFQSNSKIITVSDEMLETLINMKR